jgi:hypothetical protein
VVSAKLLLVLVVGGLFDGVIGCSFELLFVDVEFDTLVWDGACVV